MRVSILALLMVGTLAGPALKFEHAGSSCKMTFSGTKLDTDCSLKMGSPVSSPGTVSELEFAYADNTCAMFFDGSAVTTSCNLGKGFTASKPASFDGTGAKIVFDSKSAKCEFSYDGTTLDTNCALGSGFSSGLTAGGCADGAGKALSGHDDIWLCSWGGHGYIYDQNSKCASGYHVCNGQDIWNKGVSYDQARSTGGCFAYDSASDCDGCFQTCKSNKSVNVRSGCFDPHGPDLSGIGSGCHYSTTGRSECFRGGSHGHRGMIRSHDGSPKCYTNKNVGVACCQN